MIVLFAAAVSATVHVSAAVEAQSKSMPVF